MKSKNYQISISESRVPGDGRALPGDGRDTAPVGTALGRRRPALLRDRPGSRRTPTPMTSRYPEVSMSATQQQQCTNLLSDQDHHHAPVRRHTHLPAMQQGCIRCRTGKSGPSCRVPLEFMLMCTPPAQDHGPWTQGAHACLRADIILLTFRHT